MTTFCRLDELGLEVLGQRVEPDRAILACRPTTLEVIIRRYRCAGCGHVWRQDTSRAAEPGGVLGDIDDRGDDREGGRGERAPLLVGDVNTTPSR